MRFAMIALFLLLVLMCAFSHVSAADETGRLVVRIEGTFAGPIPPTLTIAGGDMLQSASLGAAAIAAGELRYEDLESGIYRAAITGGAAGAEGNRLEVGVHAGRTTVLVIDLADASLRVDPDRPDPFGLDDDWGPLTNGALPGSGEDAAVAAETSPLAPRDANLDGLDLADRGMRSRTIVHGLSVADALSIPIGPVSASEETAERSLLSDSRSRFVDAEGTTGSQGGGSGEGTLAYTLGRAPWKPRIFASIRGRTVTDAAPSVFGGGQLPHNNLDLLDLFTRLDLRPGPSTRIGLSLYGTGSSRNYFLESFRKDSAHSPREDQASFTGSARGEHRFGSRTTLLAEGDWMRTYVATGDGRFFDVLSRYAQPYEDYIATDRNQGLYWADAHVYDYYRKNVQVDLTGRLEAWRDTGTRHAVGLGGLIRRGTYRSYEDLNPIQTILGDAGFTRVNSIGYEANGRTHDDSPGHEPGKPSYFGAFATARHPIAGGDVEIGARLTGYKTGQRPIRDFTHPATSGSEESVITGPEVSRSNVDPRLAYTRAVGGRTRIWLSGGVTTRTPPSEALYYSSDFVLHANTPGAPESTVIGNPALKPERDWMAVAAAGVRAGRSLWLRAGLAGTRTRDAITPRAFATDAGSTIFAYVNDGKREVGDLFTRLEWEPTKDVRIIGSYDLSKSRTESVEPALLDEGWADPGLPIRGPTSQEGLPAIFPFFDDGSDHGFFASSSDRRHRVAAILTFRPTAESLGDAMTSFLQSTELTLFVHAASGAPFTWVDPYAAGTLPTPEPRLVAGEGINSGRGPWTGQLDLRASRDFPMHRGAVQLWLEILNVTGRHNVAYVYQPTGTEASDGSARMVEEGYQSRLADPIRFGEARTFLLGLRFTRRGEDL